jgi:uncharacterized protein YhbP (UPF0306 family)
MEHQLDPEKVIRSYLPQIIHMSLATSAGDKPWICEVHFAYDAELNLYFSSSVNSRHGQEIKANPQVAGSMVTQHFLGQKTRCVSFEGTARALEDADSTHPGFAAYGRRFDKGPQLVQLAKKEGSARLYQIAVSDFYLTDGYETNPPQKFHLPWQGGAPI